MRIVQITLAACMGMLAIASAAIADTVVTFADPSPGPTPTLFTFNQTGPGAGTIQGNWSGLGLTLLTPGLPSQPDFMNAQFNMPVLNTTSSFGPFYFLGSGSVNFYSGAQIPLNLLMTITFSQAVLTNNIGLGSSDFQGYGVTFSGPIFAGYTSVSNEAFSFSFANRVALPSPAMAGSYTATSSFTSSADLTIPAPGTFALLGIGGLIVARRRR